MLQMSSIIFKKQTEILEQQLADAKTKGTVVHFTGAIENHKGGL